MTHNTEIVTAQINSLLAAGHAPVNIVVNLQSGTHQAVWGEVTAMTRGEMGQALVYAFGDEYRGNDLDPVDAAADEVGTMLDADEYRAAYPIDDDE
jgi:hypothetical protein